MKRRNNRGLALRGKSALASGEFTLSTQKRSRGRLTSARWKQKFFGALRKIPSVKHACLAAGVSRSTAYRARDDDTAFAEKWNEAIAGSVDDLEVVAFKRAAEGDSRLIEFLLKSHRRDVYGDVSKLNIDARACGVLLMPQKEELPP